jgi:hypothetical protein
MFSMTLVNIIFFYSMIIMHPLFGKACLGVLCMLGYSWKFGIGKSVNLWNIIHLDTILLQLSCCNIILFRMNMPDMGIPYRVISINVPSAKSRKE